jgi:hypothetical protein
MKVPFQTAVTTGCFVLLLAVYGWTPWGSDLRDAIPGAVTGMLLVRGRPVPIVEVKLTPRSGVLTAPLVRSGPSRWLDDSNGMEAFYRALWRTEAKLATTRILHFGDSPATADLVTADARDLLQARFGDAGHGFVLIAKPWAWYGHRGIDLSGSGWNIQALTLDRAADGLHGLSGVSFTGGPGSATQIRFRGKRYGQMQLLFLRKPGSGDVAIEVNGERAGVVRTAGDEGVGAEWVGLPAEAPAVTLRALGPLRLYGVVLESGRPGLIYSSLGLNGAGVQSLLYYLEPDHWAAALKQSQADLIVLNYGSNESVYPKYVDTLYAAELRKVVDRVRTARPEASVLIMSPMDRGQRGPGGTLVTPPVMERIVAIQRQVARDAGCGFFNTFEAMGGAGTMARWYQSQPRLVSADLLHPLPQGAAIVGGLWEEALSQGFAEFKRREAARAGEILNEARQ